MFGVSFGELVIIFLVALLMFGPEKLPEIAQSLGKLMAQIRGMGDQVRDEFYRELYPATRALKNPLDAIAREANQIRTELTTPFPETAAGAEESSAPPPKPTDHEPKP